MTRGYSAFLAGLCAPLVLAALPTFVELYARLEGRNMEAAVSEVAAFTQSPAPRRDPPPSEVAAGNPPVTSCAHGARGHVRKNVVTVRGGPCTVTVPESTPVLVRVYGSGRAEIISPDGSPLGIVEGHGSSLGINAQTASRE